MAAEKTFLGTGWSFPPEFCKETGGVKMVSAEADIEESLQILLATTPGERLMHPSYGCGLKALVFETITESTLTEIKDVVERAILFFEPRISLIKVEINADQAPEGLLSILLEYTIRATNGRSNIVYPFYISEGTNVSI